MTHAKAPAKINLALVAGPTRLDGQHEVATVLQAVDLCDEIWLTPAEELVVEGFAEDTLVGRALDALAEVAGVEHRWAARIEKRIPVAAGLGGGSSDAAAALSLANATLEAPLPPEELHVVAASIGADVPFFLVGGSQLGTGDGTELVPLDLPLGYAVLLLLPNGARKESTAAVYRAFDERGGAEGFADRRAELMAELARVERPTDLAALPRNDLTASTLAADLEELGAFRADVSGAGPTVYGLFELEAHAELVATVLGDAGEAWVARPARASLPGER